ncbi:hypothetical protein COCON_G00230320 [Conger conger]|uniref:Uncharacterized protein n=1 Tax=Conger conger TaxID=82655 RepID=A0A9Q1CV42_CONCO|nr:hypothetical protein COCON_G00230320 [Conger conger]
MNLVNIEKTVSDKSPIRPVALSMLPLTLGMMMSSHICHSIRTPEALLEVSALRRSRLSECFLRKMARPDFNLLNRPALSARPRKGSLSRQRYKGHLCLSRQLRARGRDSDGNTVHRSPAPL